MKHWMILVAVVVAMWDGHARAQITAGPKPKPKCACVCKGSIQTACSHRACGCQAAGRAVDDGGMLGMMVQRSGAGPVPFKDGDIFMAGEVVFRDPAADDAVQNFGIELHELSRLKPIGGVFMPIAFYAPPRVLGPEDLIVGLTATGRSSGQALTLGIVNKLGGPIDMIIPNGLVVQPLKKAASQAMARAMKNATSQVPVTAHCLDFPKLPPLAGTAFRVAPKELQERYKSMRSVLSAVRDLHHADELEPDSDPDRYRDFISQWSLWTRGQKWNEGGFTSAFLDKTKKIVEGRGQKWTRDMEELTRKSAPGRWRDIGKVLAAATAIEGGR
jgi:hypothetical protein